MKIFLTILFILFLTTHSFAFLVVPPKQDETKEPPAPAETKPADVKPVNTKPAEEKTKPIKRIDTMIAVFDLEISDKVDKAIVRPLSESIRREIVMSGRYEVIDRGNMNKILGEQKFQLSGCASGECIVEAGQLLGVGKIVTGSIGLVGKTYYLSLSVINVETGKIENSSEDKCKCEIDDLIDSSKRLVKKLLGETVPESVASKPEPKLEPKSELKSEKPAESVPNIEMVFVKGGCYQMGCGIWTSDCYDNEKPVHEVCVDDFYIGKYEVMQAQWKAVMGNNPSYFKDCGDNCPVEYVSWNDMQDFINKLNQKTGKNYRLPTEAEWEYAARSGGKSEKYSGSNDVDSVAWYTSNSGRKTHPVGKKKPNGLGIYDMSGNVWEWVNDWYDKNYYKNSPKDNPKGPGSGSYRVIRCGGWYDIAGYVRASHRYSLAPDYRDYNIGFRLARTQ